MVKKKKPKEPTIVESGISWFLKNREKAAIFGAGLVVGGVTVGGCDAVVRGDDTSDINGAHVRQVDEPPNGAIQKIIKDGPGAQRTDRER